MGYEFAETASNIISNESILTKYYTPDHPDRMSPEFQQMYTAVHELSELSNRLNGFRMENGLLVRTEPENLTEENLKNLKSLYGRVRKTTQQFLAAKNKK